MASTAMEIMRQRMAAEAEKKTAPNTTRSTGDNASFPFWNAKPNETSTLRFIADADVENPWFWRAKETIELEFAGQVGGDYASTKTLTVKVPCVDMYEKRTCPVIKAMAPYWNMGEDEKILARKYYKKKSWLFQGFVVKSPIAEEAVPENPIRRFIVGPQIFKIIEAALMNTDFDDIPTDAVGGCDFLIAKTRTGDGQNSYNTSNFARRSRPLSEEESIAVEQFGAYNLNDFLGTRPDAEGVALIEAMFNDSFAGKPFDFASYGHAYRAYGSRNSTPQGDVADSRVVAAVTEARVTPVTAAVAPVAPARVAPARPVAAPVAEESIQDAVDFLQGNVAEETVPAAPVEKKSVQDVLAALRSRNKS